VIKDCVARTQKAYEEIPGNPQGGTAERPSAKVKVGPRPHPANAGGTGVVHFGADYNAWTIDFAFTSHGRRMRRRCGACRRPLCQLSWPTYSVVR
jgi:hypothetical protein